MIEVLGVTPNCRINWTPMMAPKAERTSNRMNVAGAKVAGWRTPGPGASAPAETGAVEWRSVIRSVSIAGWCRTLRRIEISNFRPCDSSPVPWPAVQPPVVTRYNPRTWAPGRHPALNHDPLSRKKISRPDGKWRTLSFYPWALGSVRDIRYLPEDAAATRRRVRAARRCRQSRPPKAA